MLTLASIAAASAGVTSHLLFFKHGERHLFPFRYVQALLLAIATSTVAQSQYGEVPLRQSLRASLQLAAFFLAGLYSSLVVYRLFFNPLNSIPGPFFARLTKFNHVVRNVNMDSHHQFLALHRRYGRFVRIGPNDVSVTDPDGVEVISGAGSKCTKAQWYSQDSPLTSLHTTRSRAVHDRRRRVWSPAFSDKALRGYESRVQVYNDLLIQQIKAYSGKPINVSKWFNLYSFDVMGDLGFGRSFNMLSSGETHWAIKLLNEGMDPMGLAFPPWFFRLLVAIPGLTKGYWQFIGFCSKQLDERMKMQKTSKGTENPDVTHFLIEHFDGLSAEEKQSALPMIQGDSRLIIVAGSDTTAATLVHLFYYLAREPALVARLREELAPLIGADGVVTSAKIKDAPFLEGAINETLRLNPPVPSGVFRKTPEEGVYIGNTWIAGNTVIQMPGYVVGHDESIYPDCESFVPERWYSKPEMVKHKDAFQPFSSGPFGCIGKNLAYMEVRLLTAQLVMGFDVAFAPGEDGSRLLQKTTDHFTMGLAELDLVFTERKR